MPSEAKIAAIVYPPLQGGGVDRLLSEIARGLAKQGVRVAGAVQHNTPNENSCRCDMTLEDLASGQLVSISEDRGPGATGCHLNPAALEEIVGIVSSALDGDVDLLVVNKFSKREADGRGFRQPIEIAIENGVSVLTAVNEDQLAAWEAFTGGLDTRLAAEADQILEWCAAVCPPRMKSGVIDQDAPAGQPA